MIISQWMSKTCPQMKVELDINDVAALFKRQSLFITMKTNKKAYIQLALCDVPVPVDTIIGDNAVGSAITIYVSEDAFCELLKQGTMQYMISNGACRLANEAIAINEDENNLSVILTISKRGMK